MDLTKQYRNLLEQTEMSESSASIQDYVWDSDAAFMKEGDRQTVVFDEEKYCVYDYSGRVSGMSFGTPVKDLTASMVTVKGVYEVEDYEGEFTSAYAYSLFGVGKVCAKGISSRTGEAVVSCSEYAGSRYAMSIGTSATYYTALSKDWIFGSYTNDTGDKIRDGCDKRTIA